MFYSRLGELLATKIKIRKIPGNELAANKTQIDGCPMPTNAPINCFKRKILEAFLLEL